LTHDPLYNLKRTLAKYKELLDLSYCRLKKHIQKLKKHDFEDNLFLLSQNLFQTFITIIIQAIEKDLNPIFNHF